MVGYNCFIIFQYYYLNIKILKFYENFEIFEILNFLKLYMKFLKCFEILTFFEYCMGVTKLVTSVQYYFL